MSADRPLGEHRTQHLLKFTWYYWRQRPGLLALVVFLMLACTVLVNVVVPLYVRQITDLIAQVPNPVNQAKIWHGFVVFSAIYFFQSLLWTLAIFFWNIFSCHILYKVLGDGLYKVQRFSTDWHSNTFAGGTVRKITRGMSSFDVFSDRLVIGFLVIFMVMGATIIALATTLPYVASYMAFIIVLYTAVSLYVSSRYQVPLFRRAAEADTMMGSTLADIITGIPTIKSFASEEREDARFGDVREEWRNRALTAWQTSRIIDGLRTTIRIFLLVGMLGITIWQWGQGQATPGDVAMVLTCFFLTQHMLRDVGTFMNDIQKSSAEMEDIVSFWLRDDDVKDRVGVQPLRVERGGSEIVFDRVHFRYAPALPLIYQDLSIRIAPGEKVALVGKSGSGKSTFIKLIQRLYDIQGGDIRIDGQNIADVTQKSLRAQIAVVPQDPILFHRTLAENIAYGRPSATREEIEQAARQAFAHEFITQFPQGYDTLVGERGVKLSGGERQRVAIARAILADTPILVLDEATSSLDSVSEGYIQQALERLMQGRTTITVAHRLATIRRVDRILVFDRGQIIEQGSHAALLENAQSIYKRLYDMQALGLISDNAA